MSRFARLGLVGSVVLLLVAGGCARWSPKVWVEEQRSLKVPVGFTRLDVTSHNGEIRATGRDEAATVDVTAKVRGGGASLESAQACLKAIEITSATTGAVHALATKYNVAPASDWASEVSFEIQMPRQLDLVATSHNGAVVAVNLDGACTLTSHNGAIRAETGPGDLIAETHNGAISARTRAARVRLTSHNGEVEAAILAAGPAAGTVESYNGQIRLALGEAVAADLTCDTANGGIAVDIPWQAQQVQRSYVTGRIGAAGAAGVEREIAQRVDPSDAGDAVTAG